MPDTPSSRGLQVLDPASLTFTTPAKKIHNEADVDVWKTTAAYADILTFLHLLNAAMFPHIEPGASANVQYWELDSPAVPLSSPVLQLQALLAALDELIASAPPATGPRRFGNVAFRVWYKLAEDKLDELLDTHVPKPALAARVELRSYLLGSFGSAQRLDYGTGHELSFLAFLGGLWKMGVFETGTNGIEERGIVLGVIEPYLRLIRRLILTYNLEPAGSHGVWGLDDHSFLPYIFGSAQLSPPVSDLFHLPTEGSASNAPDPPDVTKKPVVERERTRNMYFSAIGFINDVKRGPFWEHSPILFDISGVKAGWAKINIGMMKMYAAEVLAKFPVIQHFPFGALFSWERAPGLPPAPEYSNPAPMARPTATQAGAGTAAPWTAAGSQGASARMPPPPQAGTGTAAPWAAAGSQAASARMPPPQAGRGTAAPWASTGSQGASARMPPPTGTRAPFTSTTRAPMGPPDFGGEHGTGP
ncbi:rotamase PTPA-1 [Trichodelitschia bisporula]|uniref:Serine/threonine-protein phosphatase 2A activator n=1 Tax=Trichodelitschia bisporula TaxID=703511 RepID=A0A6G1HRT7_9PEZI|nr:rotamase PTPA-1 [Trichodelitschia bisporula]